MTWVGFVVVVEIVIHIPLIKGGRVGDRLPRGDDEFWDRRLQLEAGFETTQVRAILLSELDQRIEQLILLAFGECLPKSGCEFTLLNEDDLSNVAFNAPSSNWSLQGVYPAAASAHLQGE